MTSTDELLPCPFCGGEAGAVQKQYGDWRDEIGVICSKCNAIMLRPEIELVDAETHVSKKAIAAWNTRHEQIYVTGTTITGDGEPVVYVPERTCRDTGESRLFRCSECGFGIEDAYLANEGAYGLELDFVRFCPSCGRKVVNP